MGDRLAAIEASLALVADRAGDPVPAVYARLFSLHPAMEAEFWRDGSGAIRGEMLTRVLETVLDMAGPRAWGEHLIIGEMVTHDNYGIPRPLFAGFFRLVADVLRELGGDGWTPAMDAAWGDVLAEIDSRLAALLPAG